MANAGRSADEVKRMLLLSHNPYLRQDARKIRKFLGLPRDGIRDWDHTEQWIAQHKLAHIMAVAAEYSVDVGDDPTKVLEAWRAALSWRKAQVQARYVVALQSGVRLGDEDIAEPFRLEALAELNPLRALALDLIRRYGVPKVAPLRMERYIVRNGANLLAHHNLAKLFTSELQTDTDQRSISITVYGLTELTTEAEWLSVWRDEIKPKVPIALGVPRPPNKRPNRDVHTIERSANWHYQFYFKKHTASRIADDWMSTIDEERIDAAGGEDMVYRVVYETERLMRPRSELAL